MHDYVVTVRIPATMRRELTGARIAHLATVGNGKPAIVPISFVLLAQTLYHAIDAKPKRRPVGKLRRVRNLRINPHAAAIIDHYEEDWQKLWFVLIEGSVRFLTEGPEHRRAISALKRKYVQYQRMPLDPAALVIALDIRHLVSWRAASGAF